MDTSKLTSEWIQTFNRLGSEGKLKPTVPYHDLFSRKELKGFPLHTLPTVSYTHLDRRTSFIRIREC